MNRKMIIVLEDNEDRITAMKSWLNGMLAMYEHFISSDPQSVIHSATSHWKDVLVMSLDHDLFEDPNATTETTGMLVADYLVKKTPQFPILIHSSNDFEAGKMQRRLQRKQWSVERVTPFNDTEWIRTDWFPKIRKLIHSQAIPHAVGVDDDED